MRHRGLSWVLLVTILTCGAVGVSPAWAAAPADGANDKAVEKPKPKPKDPKDKPKAGNSADAAVSAFSTAGGAAGGAGSAFGVPVAASQDPFSGSFTATIPIAIPPGRVGMQPTIQLLHGSGGPSSWVGVGWQLDLGTIERRTRFGTDYSKDEYVLRVNGATSDLMPVSPGSSEFRVKIETGFLRIKKVSPDGASGWEVTDPRGVKSFYGQTAQSRRADPSYPTSRIFAWLVDRAQDPHGNFTRVTYWTDSSNNEVYLDEVTYTGFGSTDGANAVKFYREARPDAPESYLSNYKIKTAYRLKSIAVRNNGALQRVYQLTYGTSASTARSVLTTVQQFDRNASINTSTGAVTGSSLPSTTFTTTDPPTPLTEPAKWIPYLNESGNPNANTPFNFVGDYNGDGKADYMFLSGGEHVALSTGTGFAPLTTWLSTPILCSPEHQGCVTTGDFNADGRTDLIWNAGGGNHWVALANDTGTAFTGPHLWTSGAAYNPGYQFAADMDGDGRTDWLWFANNAWYVALSKGDHFESSGQPWITGAYANLDHQFLGDFNGDGKTDFMYLHGGGAGWSVMLSTGTSFTTPTQWIAGSWNPWCEMVGDFNGDGKTDLMWCDTARTYVALSTGSSFAPGTEWIYGVGQYSYNINFQTVTDLNGDGKADVVWSGGGDSTIRALMSTGNAFIGPVTVVNWTWDPENPNSLDKLYIGDFNGDGRGDLMWLTIVCPGGYSCGPDGFYVSVGQSDTDGNRVADYIKGITNGLGGSTTIKYIPSTQLVNLQLPYAIHVVKEMYTNDGNGNNARTDYNYRDGFYHLGERDFRGFAYADVTGPLGPAYEQFVTETWFHQGNKVTVGAETLLELRAATATEGYTRGKPYRTRITDISGYVWSDTTTEYAADADGVAPWFTPPLQVLASTCAGTSTSCTSAKQTRTDLTYDHTYGTVIREDQHGDINTLVDDRTITRTFSPNTTTWIVQLPATEKIFAGIGAGEGNKKSETTFFYDGTTSCGTASTTPLPEFGKLTRVVKWLSGGTNPETRMAYDTYGNQICLRDPSGNTTTTAYDAGTSTFPVTTTNALEHAGTTQYYGVNGVAMDNGLYGQMKSVTDPNGRTSSSAYDSFGRPASTTAANGLVTTTSYNSLGTVGSQHVLTSRTVGGVNFQSWTYLDGLGRTIKAKSTGPSAQNIVTLTEYNIRGQVKRSSLPHFENGTPLWRSMTYDPLGRVKTVSGPDGRTITSCYGPWVSVVIDPKQHKKRQVVDAAGRTVKVQEYTTTFDPTQCHTDEGSPYATTTYQYDVLSNLTSVTDALGNQTTMTYDTLSRKTAMHDPDMGNWSYAYDAAGNLTQQTDAKNQTIYFQYDALNRRRQKDFGTLKALGSGDVVYTYDGATANNLVGRLASMVDASGSVSYQYDVMGQITRSDRTFSGSTTIYTTVSWHDLLGRVSTIQYPDHTVSAPSLVNYEYTGPFLNRVYDATSGYNFAQYSNYNALGQPVSIAYGNGVTTYFTYEANTFRTKSLQTSKGGTTFQNLEYVYDPADNVSTITDYLTSANTQTFTYDGLNRLTSAAATSYGPLSYTYNEIGNLTSNSALTPSAYTYPASGASSVRPHAVTTAGPNSYTYDANGNMLSGAGRTFNSYNVENRPTSLTVGSTTTTFVYDGDGARVKKTTGTSIAWYISKLYECDATTCQKYIWGGSQRIAVKQVSNSQIHFYHGNHLGSTNVVTDGAGVEVQRVNYTPFGEVVGAVPTIAYKYTGKERDSATGLYWYEWRSYDPLLARFTSPDTVVGNPKDPQDLDRYGYARKNPLKYTDPTGHFVWAPVLIAVAVSATAGAVMAGISSNWNLKAMAIGAAIGAAAGAAGGAAGVGVWAAAGGSAAGGVPAIIAGGIVGGMVGGLTSATLNQLAGNKANWGPSIAYGGAAGGIGAGVGGGLSSQGVNVYVSAIAGGVAAGTARAGMSGGNILKGALMNAGVAAVSAYLVVHYGASPAEAQARAEDQQAQGATSVDVSLLSASDSYVVLAANQSGSSGHQPSMEDLATVCAIFIHTGCADLGATDIGLPPFILGHKHDIQMINSIQKELGLTNFQRELLHDEIRPYGGKLSYQEMKEIGKQIQREFPHK